jgi:predicted ester cyclase
MSEFRELLDRYVALYNAGDLDGVMELYAEDAVQGMPDGIFEGRDAIHERLARELEAIPDVTHTVVSFIEQGDAFADEWRFVGTQTGPFLLPNGSVLPPTGRRVEVSGMEVVRVGPDGKIVLNVLYYDNLAVAVQLGLVPEGAVA